MFPPFAWRWPVLAPVALGPFAGPLVREFCAVTEPSKYNPLLGRTAALLLAYGVLFTVGLVLGAP